MQFFSGYGPPLVLEAAVRHRVFDVLADGPRTLEQIRSATGASSRGLRAILDALVGLELLAKPGGGRYALTPESEAYLVSSKPGFTGGMLRHVSTQLLPAWMKLNEVVRTGRPAEPVNRESTGTPFFEQFVEDLYPVNEPTARALADHLGVAGARQPVLVLDLAAGSGVWGIALARKSSQVRVTAVDWPGVLPVTRRMAERHGVADRFRFVAGDLAEADFGTGHHLATLGHILHSEGARRSRALLHKTFAALAPGATVVIAEQLPNEERTGPPWALLFAVNMLVHTDEGDVFTFGEIRDWLSEAGFRDARSLAGPSSSPLILATKPEA
jgi:precorrin-6B methylase 2